MKPLIFALICLAIVFLLLFFFRYEKGYEGVNENQDKLQIIKIGNAQIRVSLADTEMLREKGLQNVEKMDGEQGMLFLFANPRPATFWNKNTLIDLDLIWIRDKHVSGISFLPNESGGGKVYVSSPGAIEYVVEANAGFASSRGIKIGDKVEGI